MVAVPDFVESCFEVAAIVTWAVLVAVSPVTSAVSLPIEATVATAVLDDFHVTVGSKSPVPATVAAHCVVAPPEIVVELQETVTDVMVAGWLTVTMALVPVTVPEVAVNVAVPAATPVAMPDAVIVATFALVELHVVVAEFVRFCVEPSEYVPIAVIWSVPPTMRDGDAAVTAIESKVGVGLMILLPPPPQVIKPKTAAHASITTAIRAILVLLGLFTFHLPERQYCELETRLPLPLGGEGGPHRRFHQPGRDG
jgi:hypothetical protein